MTLTAADLPHPDPAAAAVSHALAARIAAEITAAGGWLPFDRYMRLALYEPGLGYYSAGSTKLGPAGDFTTGPELGNFLARAVADRLSGMLGVLERPVVLELGAGNGVFARDLLAALAERELGAIEYWILEPSADLRRRQQQRLAPLGKRVRWLDRLPDAPFDGLVVGNEVLDALPVARFVKRRRQVLPLGVCLGPDGFEWRDGPPDAVLSAAVAELERSLADPLPDGYRSEINLALPAFIASVAAPLERGAMLWIDYGLPQRELYHPERSDGTLICHYRQRAHDDPFVLPGLQDLSAWVDFSACADAAVAAGLEIAGFTTQGQFLAAALAQAPAAAIEALGPRQHSALKTLLLPGEMGERFKLLLAVRGVSGISLPGRDFRGRL
jgi:SAM-dependent MidA family methyltransferase